MRIFLSGFLGVLAVGALEAAEIRFEFLEPASHSAFLEGEEIPLILLAQVPKEIVTSADVFVDGQPVGMALYCCPWCRCPPPMEGTLIELRMPGLSGESPWQGLTNLPRGFHRITAAATGSGGTVLPIAVAEIVVLGEEDLRLRVSVAEAGELSFVLPGGSLVFGGFDMWLSHDLNEWSRLGPFEPGAVAAFFRDHPDSADQRPRYYRALPQGSVATSGP